MFTQCKPQEPCELEVYWMKSDMNVRVVIDPWLEAVKIVVLVEASTKESVPQSNGS